MKREKQSEWWLPENLRQQEKSEIAKIENGENVPNTDMSAYYRLLKHGRDDWARMHVVMDAGDANRYADQSKAAIAVSGFSFKRPLVLDIGCGPGVITDALRRSFKASVTGLDASESAIQWARKQYAECRFEAIALDEDSVLPQKYDIIHAREFYPFTRTNDFDTHRKYLTICAKFLNLGGVLIIAQIAKERSLADNAKDASKYLQSLGFSPLSPVLVANDKLSQMLPLAFARAITPLLDRCLGRPSRYFYVARRLSDAPMPRIVL